MKPIYRQFTVFGVHEDNGQIVCHHVVARNGLNAFAAVAKKDDGENLSMVAAIPGYLSEGIDFDLPGEGLVDGDTVLEQSDVFGRAPKAEAVAIPFKVAFVFGAGACTDAVVGNVSAQVIAGFREFEFSTEKERSAFVQGVCAGNDGFSFAAVDGDFLKKIQRKMATLSAGN